MKSSSSITLSLRSHHFLRYSMACVTQILLIYNKDWLPHLWQSCWTHSQPSAYLEIALDGGGPLATLRCSSAPLLQLSIILRGHPSFKASFWSQPMPLMRWNWALLHLLPILCPQALIQRVLRSKQAKLHFRVCFQRKLEIGVEARSCPEEPAQPLSLPEDLVSPCTATNSA